MQQRHVLIVTTDETEMKETLDGLLKFHQDYGIEITLLVGENWIINSPVAADYKADLGGKLMYIR